MTSTQLSRNRGGTPCADDTFRKATSSRRMVVGYLRQRTKKFQSKNLSLMRCSACNAELPPGELFCGECGSLSASGVPGNQPSSGPVAGDTGYEASSFPAPGLPQPRKSNGTVLVVAAIVFVVLGFGGFWLYRHRNAPAPGNSAHRQSAAHGPAARGVLTETTLPQRGPSPATIAAAPALPPPAGVPIAPQATQSAPAGIPAATLAAAGAATPAAAGTPLASRGRSSAPNPGPGTRSPIPAAGPRGTYPGSTEVIVMDNQNTSGTDGSGAGATTAAPESGGGSGGAALAQAAPAYAPPSVAAPRPAASRSEISSSSPAANSAVQLSVDETPVVINVRHHHGGGGECRGVLQVSSGRISFRSNEPSHGFDLPLAQVSGFQAKLRKGLDIRLNAAGRAYQFSDNSSDDAAACGELKQMHLSCQ